MTGFWGGGPSSVDSSVVRGCSNMESPPTATELLLEEPMVLDPQIRDWVVLPMVGIMVSLGSDGVTSE